MIRLDQKQLTRFALFQTEVQTLVFDVNKTLARILSTPNQLERSCQLSMSLRTLASNRSMPTNGHDLSSYVSCKNSSAIDVTRTLASNQSMPTNGHDVSSYVSCKDLSAIDVTRTLASNQSMPTNGHDLSSYVSCKNSSAIDVTRTLASNRSMPTNGHNLCSYWFQLEPITLSL